VAAAQKWMLEHGQPVALACADRPKAAGVAPRLRVPPFRSRSVQRRIAGAEAIYTAGELTIDFDRCIVSLGGVKSN
jgi:hypothetical protein